MASRSDRLRIPDDELEWRFSRSSGPGGQHVNTTDTRVELLWRPATSRILSEPQKARVIARLANRMSDGRVTLSSSQFRSQHRNREAARVRLEELVARAVVAPKSRRSTKPSRGAVERRLDAKRRRSDLKRSRSSFD